MGALRGQPLTLLISPLAVVCRTQTLRFRTWIYIFELWKTDVGSSRNSGGAGGWNETKSAFPKKPRNQIIRGNVSCPASSGFPIASSWLVLSFTCINMYKGGRAGQKNSLCESYNLVLCQGLAKCRDCLGWLGAVNWRPGGSQALNTLAQKKRTCAIQFYIYIYIYLQ